MFLSTNTSTNSSPKKFMLSWILFLGVLPYDKAALTLYTSASLGEIIALILNAITFAMCFIVFFRNNNASNLKVAMKYISYFFVLFMIYLFGSLISDTFQFSRLFSMACLLAYYIYCIFKYENLIDLISSINFACLFIIVLSFIFYLFKNPNVFYVEDSTTLTFKGIAANRNSYSEITLFFVATNFCVFLYQRKNLFWFIFSTVLAIYTTFLTNSATSVVCIALLILFLIFGLNEKLRSKISFKGFFVIYICLFFVLIIFNNTSFGLAKWITNIFDKDSTFTGRTNLWDATLNVISKNILVGQGYETEILKFYGMEYSDPHNSFLYILLTQGVLGMIAFIIMIYGLFSRKNTVKLKRNSINFCLVAFIIVWMIRGLVESGLSYTHFVFWIALIIIDSLREKELKNGGTKS